MGDSTLVSRLRAADGFASIAAAIIDELGMVPGVLGVAVEAHVGGEPAQWFGTSAFSPVDARRYLDGGFRTDRLIARVRAGQAPVREGLAWIAPIVGCGELVGAIRIVVDRPERDCSSRLQLLSILASVRVAELGGLGAEASGLTARQHEIAVLVSRGCTNQEIANMLAISANAVKKHISRALEVLAVSNRTELAALAARWTGAPRQRLNPAIYVLAADRAARCAVAA